MEASTIRDKLHAVVLYCTRHDAVLFAYRQRPSFSSIPRWL